jgi:hypothetical protein
MIVVDPSRRPTAEAILRSDAVQRRIEAGLYCGEAPFETPILRAAERGRALTRPNDAGAAARPASPQPSLLATIAVPRDLRKLAGRLPDPNYSDQKRERTRSRMPQGGEG